MAAGDHPVRASAFGVEGLDGLPDSFGQRIREAVQMGFTRIVMPSANLDPDEGNEGGAELVGDRSEGEALDALI